MDISIFWKSAYPAYLAVMALMVAWIVATPLLALAGNSAAAGGYEAGKYICHQKISRSLCLFGSPQWRIGDCTPQNGTLRNDLRSEICADGKGDVRQNCIGLQGYGYKFPVSARDLAIYAGMLIGALAFPVIRKTDSRHVPHWIWLVLALLPLALDGTTQLLGWRESANSIRIATGLLAGVTMSLYAIPILNSIVIAAKEGDGRKEVPAKKEDGKIDADDFDGWKTLAAGIGISAVAFIAMQLLMHPGFI